MMLLPLLEITFKPEAMLLSRVAFRCRCSRGRQQSFQTDCPDDAGEQVLGRWQQSLGTECLGNLHGQIPTGQNLDFSADHSIRFGARSQPRLSLLQTGSTPLLSRT